MTKSSIAVYLSLIAGIIIAAIFVAGIIPRQYAAEAKTTHTDVWGISGSIRINMTINGTGRLIYRNITQLSVDRIITLKYIPKIFGYGKGTVILGGGGTIILDGRIVLTSESGKNYTIDLPCMYARNAKCMNVERNSTITIGPGNYTVTLVLEWIAAGEVRIVGVIQPYFIEHETKTNVLQS